MKCKGCARSITRYVYLDVDAQAEQDPQWRKIFEREPTFGPYGRGCAAKARQSFVERGLTVRGRRGVA